MDIQLQQLVNRRLFLLGKDLSLTEIFERSEAGVVRVNVIKAEQIPGLNGVGSGFVFDQRGHVITNHHVIDNSEKIVVTFLDGSSYNANTVGSDPFTDIAVLKVDADAISFTSLYQLEILLI